MENLTVWESHKDKWIRILQVCVRKRKVRSEYEEVNAPVERWKSAMPEIPLSEEAVASEYFHISLFQPIFISFSWPYVLCVSRDFCAGIGPLHLGVVHVLFDCHDQKSNLHENIALCPIGTILQYNTSWFYNSSILRVFSCISAIWTHRIIQVGQSVCCLYQKML